MDILNYIKELEEEKRITELTKISCCTAQNCGALENGIREGLENEKLRKQLADSTPNSAIRELIDEYSTPTTCNKRYISNENLQLFFERLLEIVKKGER